MGWGTSRVFHQHHYPQDNEKKTEERETNIKTYERSLVEVADVRGASKAIHSQQGRFAIQDLFWQFWGGETTMSTAKIGAVGVRSGCRVVMYTDSALSSVVGNIYGDPSIIIRQGLRALATICPRIYIFRDGRFRHGSSEGAENFPQLLVSPMGLRWVHV